MIPRLLEPLARRSGVRIGFLGNTGEGKSRAVAWLLDEAFRGGFVDLAIVVDDKPEEPPYSGARRVNPEHCRAFPPRPEEGPICVYRGAAGAPTATVDVEDVAAQSWELVAMEGRPRVVLVVDELRRAVSPAGREWRAPTAARALAEGRGPGLSVLWTTQAPQRIPVEAMDQSDLVVFHLGHRGRGYLERSDLVTPDASEAIRSLQQRQFILIEAGSGDWDGRVYEVPFRR